MVRGKVVLSVSIPALIGTRLLVVEPVMATVWWKAVNRAAGSR